MDTNTSPIPGKAGILACLDWRSDSASHQDCMLLPAAALQAQGPLARAATELPRGPVQLDPGPWLLPRDEPERELPLTAFRLRQAPLPGRHYPRLAFSGLASGQRDLRPCRVLEVAGEQLRLDSNHPLARHGARLSLSLSDAQPGTGRFQNLLEGPGMQAPPADAQACYLPAEALCRQDEDDDAGFYAQPRLVHHLDAHCRAGIEALHARLLAPGMRVLDLMSSWVTHLPDDLPDGLSLTGLGMNAAELESNPRLRRRLVHDLNRQPALPFEDDAFDLVLCTAAIEYLNQPRAVLAEVARVLRPGGSCVLSFSDRWFPPKAIRVWSELHPFERLGMALWLLRDAGFVDLHSQSMRGLKRPAADKYAAELEFSDPLFAAWGKVAAPAS